MSVREDKRFGEFAALYYAVIAGPDLQSMSARGVRRRT